MALLTHRDPFVVGDRARGAGSPIATEPDDVRVISAEHPSIGYSSETVLVELAWSGGDVGARARATNSSCGSHRRRSGPSATTTSRSRRSRSARPRRPASRSRHPSSSPTRVARRAVRRHAAGARSHHRRGRGARPVAALADGRAARASARVVRRRDRGDASRRPRRRGRRSRTRQRGRARLLGGLSRRGRAAARRFPRSSTRSSGAAPTDRRTESDPGAAAGATSGSAT